MTLRERLEEINFSTTYAMVTIETINHRPSERIKNEWPDEAINRLMYSDAELLDELVTTEEVETLDEDPCELYTIWIN